MMSSIFYRDSKFIYEGKEGRRTLLDCKDYLSNKSRIPMYRHPEQCHRIISDIVSDMFLWEKENGDDPEFSVGLILMDTLIVNELIKTSQPVRVLEYGSGKGRLSRHLAELLGLFHEQSTLICAYDTIEPEWMEQISKVGQLPKISFFAGDYGDFQLPENFFDIVIINGKVNYEEPYQVILDAIRLAKEDSVIFCYVNNTPLLESIFQLFFELREEYEITPFSKVMLAKTENRCWEEYKKVNFAAQALENIERAKKICSEEKVEKNILFTMIETLKQDIKHIIEIGDVDLKLQLLEQKELLLQCVFEQ